MRKILIPTQDGFYRSVLSISRSLGKKGCEVHILSSFHKVKRFQNLLRSKYCKYYGFCPDPMKEPVSFIKKLQTYIERYNIDIIFPVIDSVAVLLAYARNCFKTNIPLPDYKSFELALNKHKLMKFAEKIRIPIPKTAQLTKETEIDSILKTFDLDFPVILKPQIRGDGLEGTKLINSKEQLLKILKKFNEIGKIAPIYNYEAPIIQEFVKGTIYDCCTLSYKGKLKQCVTQFRYRTLNSFGGAGAVNITSHTPEIIKYSKKLLEKLNWTGPAQVEWIKTKKNEFKLMEINPRFWGTTQLSIDAGLDFPYETLKLFLNGVSSKKKKSYQKGIKKRWLFPEEIVSVLRDKGNFRMRMKEFLNFYEFLSPNVKSNYYFNDLKPEFYKLLFTVPNYI